PELERRGERELLAAPALPLPPDGHGRLAAGDEARGRREPPRARDEIPRDVAGLALKLARHQVGPKAQAPRRRDRRVGDERVVADDDVLDAVEERITRLRRLRDLTRAAGLEPPHDDARHP